MLVNVVQVEVKPGHVEEFIDAILKNHAGTRQEPGNRRFDVLQAADDATRFTLYEAFDSQEAVEAHRKTAHYLEWRSKVEPWMVQPRKGVTHKILAPKDPTAW